MIQTFFSLHRGRRLVGLLLFVSCILAVSAARAEKIVLIEENFEEAHPGSRVTAGSVEDSKSGTTGIRPEVGSYHAFTGNEGEIVEGWEGQAFQFQDKIPGAALRLVFDTARDVDPVTGGKVEVSLDFRVDGGEAPYEGNPLQVVLSAPTQSRFLTAIIYRENGKFYHTNRSTAPAHEGMTQGPVIASGVVYQLKFILDFDQGTYAVELSDKKGKEVLYQAEEQQFVTIPDLAGNGLGSAFLDIQAGPDFSGSSEPPTTVTIDNLLVSLLD